VVLVRDDRCDAVGFEAASHNVSMRRVDVGVYGY
jgi:hypothetical protein